MEKLTKVLMKVAAILLAFFIFIAAVVSYINKDKKLTPPVIYEAVAFTIQDVACTRQHCVLSDGNEFFWIPTDDFNPLLKGMMIELNGCKDNVCKSHRLIHPVKGK